MVTGRGPYRKSRVPPLPDFSSSSEREEQLSYADDHGIRESGRDNSFERFEPGFVISASRARGDHDLSAMIRPIPRPTRRRPIVIHNRTQSYVPLAQENFPNLPRSCSSDDVPKHRPERLYHEVSAVEFPSTVRSSSLGSCSAKTFVYRSLHAPTDFRLVKLLPKKKKKTNQLKCEIVHTSLLNPPKYVAISYAWGDGFDKKTIALEDDDNFLVHASLHDALMAVRKPSRPILVWIDGLSINQEDEKERAAQVQLMDRIYTKATYVAIWLGPEMNDSARAIRVLEELRDGRRASEWIDMIDQGDRVALSFLFNRDYWKRLWVVQEIYHARRKVVYCGSSNLPWHLHKQASDALWQHETDPYLLWTGPSSFPDVERLVKLGPNSPLEVLRACRRKLSGNPRDKIFAVLGLLPSGVREDLQVRYDKSAKALYLDVAALIIRSTDRLDMIREAIYFPSHVSSADLPTWCPDWAYVPETSSLSSKDYSAAGDTHAQCDLTDGLRKLEISAIELGVIDTTGMAVGTLCALQDYLMAFLNWRTLLISFFNVDKDQETMHPCVFDFCFTLSLGHWVQGWQDHWTEACYQVFSSLTQERLPRLELDHNFRRHRESSRVAQNDRRSFIQKHFGDRMVSLVLLIFCCCMTFVCGLIRLDRANMWSQLQMGRTFCITRGGLIGMGTGFMRRGDIVVVPFGCSTPILLRAEGQSNEFRYVGDVYIHGYMHGEALTSGKLAKKYTLH